MPTPPSSEPSQPVPGRLALQDGAVFRGQAFGAFGRGIVQAAEVVFNTAMCGYQEALTDPSYAGQILVMTAPLIGNTGINARDVESVRVQVSGFIVRELARRYSNFRAQIGLSEYLAQSGVLGLAGIDTRALTKRLRVAGVMQGVITDDPKLSDAQLVERARTAPSMEGQNLVPLVGCSSPQSWSEALGEWSVKQPGAPENGEPSSNGQANASGSPRRFRVLAFDCGAKRNILRNLVERGCDVTVIPHTTSAAEVRRLFDAGQVDGLFISNGPGDPAAVDATIKTLSDLVRPAAGPSIPIFGICLGHQLLAIAAGAKTFKLKFGHRGANQPVLNLFTRKVEITSQNHGFAVDPESLAGVGGQPTHVHLNDRTLAGFRLADRPVFAVQYHPEASPGPHDSSYLFDTFVTMMTDRLPAWHTLTPAPAPVQA